LAAAAFVLSYFQVQLLMSVSQRTGTRIRKLYFQSLMRQDFAWYDSESSGELTSRVASDANLIQAGIGDKVGSAIQFIASGIVAFAVAMFYSWKLTFVILSVTPILAFCEAALAQLTASSIGEGQGAYGDAGAVAHEVLSLIKTVSAFGGQEEEARRYEKYLDNAYKSGAKKSITAGLGVGITMFFLFCAYACVKYLCLSLLLFDWLERMSNNVVTFTCCLPFFSSRPPLDFRSGMELASSASALSIFRTCLSRSSRTSFQMQTTDVKSSSSFAPWQTLRLRFNHLSYVTPSTHCAFRSSS
jgi:ABC-type multidrug transport system fused ATPase/permease subunit